MKILGFILLFSFFSTVALAPANASKSVFLAPKGNPTLLQIASGLKNALVQGTSKSSDQLSALNGFFGDTAVKIFFPPQAQKAERTLREIGLGKLCDDVILSLNRAAEDAAKQAKPIFVDAIKKMTFDDVKAILTGQQDAATQYFKKNTSDQLTATFNPIVKASLDKVGATKYYSQVANEYNKIPFVGKLDPNIDAYVTQKAIDGLFLKIAIEELNIRKNLDARTTPVMKKVFAYADKLLKL